eukprot:CAMPEP_0194292234 /NCGR_PEP_ID=MMETSP0169-20130528/45194_1 /TAXON_ID=218684 /ORGANISM="Corethron pennatum, Strain L29A3" /LENGTH=37 /DNA_ID= /DNA_START= /DNA_END= /DNA_ORIENTATION=
MTNRNLVLPSSASLEYFDFVLPVAEGGLSVDFRSAAT